MPLARIITNSADDSLELSMQLRARGFVVETVSPDEVPETPADLEVLMEECAPEDVLIRAAEVTESEDLWVFVAPGALDDRGRPGRSALRMPPVRDEQIARVSAWRKEREAPAVIREPKPEHLVAADLASAPAPILSPKVLRPDAQPSIMNAKLDAVVPDAGLLASPLSSDASSTKLPIELPPPKVKVVVVPKTTEQPLVPEVPERVVPVIALPQPPVDAAPRRALGPYKIAFRTGPVFWKQAAVSVVLVVLAGVLAAVIGLRPSLPTAGKPAAVSSPPAQPSRAPAAAQSVPAPASQGRAIAPTSATVAKPTAPKQDEKKALASAPAPVTTEPSAAPIKPHPAAKGQHPPGWLSDRDIIAEDTVVFFDGRRGKPVSPKTKNNPPVKQRSDTD